MRETQRAGPCGLVLGGLVVLLWAALRTERVQVRGTSMLPALHPGDRVLVLRAGGPWRRPRVGDLVVLADPRVPTRVVVKRLVGLGEHGADVRGDHPAASTDSRTFGCVPAAALRGRAVYRYVPPERAGRLLPPR